VALSSSSGGSAANSTSCNSTAAPAGCGHDAAQMSGLEGASTCPAECITCCTAARLLITLRSLEHPMAPCVWDSGAVTGQMLLGLLKKAAHQQGATLQQYMWQQLLALAWRHPVPGVCSNMLCGRLEGPAAVGLVRNRVRSVCGRCRAAWYCCEDCQRAAWPDHRAVCRAPARACAASGGV
jgi:hypothetical protein